MCGGETDWDIYDFDLRRTVTIHGPPDLLDDEKVAMETFGRHADNLASEARSFEVNRQGRIVRVWSEHDPNYALQYPLYFPDQAENTTRTELTLKRSELIEVDRLGQAVDLVRRTNGNSEQLLVFKYNLTEGEPRRHLLWEGTQILKALKNSQHIVPFHRAVLDEEEPRLLGFTTIYLPGGTLDANSKFPFSLCWLNQLIDAVDYLNLDAGVAHQDIAGRNVLIDLNDMTLKLFDFDFAAKIGSTKKSWTKYEPCRNDVDGLVFTVYETFTKDFSYRQIPHDEQNVKLVEDLPDWPIVIDIEEKPDGVAAYRTRLQEWAQERRTTRRIDDSSQAASPISWPDMPPLTLIKWPQDLGHGTTEIFSGYDIRVDVAKKLGIRYIDWEREPYSMQYGSQKNGDMSNGAASRQA